MMMKLSIEVVKRCCLLTLLIITWHAFIHVSNDVAYRSCISDVENDVA
jgi:hypothetical protein